MNDERESRRHGRLLDTAICAVIWIFIGLLNGSEPWVSFDTPDSEFHASMAIFGHEVTDRASVPVYYWTRLGYIAPAHVLTGLFGPLTGLELYRLLLLAAIIGCLFATLRHFTSRFNATMLTALVCSNTVLLGYLGNPYPTATAFAAFFALIAAAVFGTNWRAHAAAGGVLGWLIMTNPFGFVIGVVLYLSALSAGRHGLPKIRSVLRWSIAVVAGAIVTFAAFWVIGRFLFPGFDWLSTYLFWNSVLNQADYIDSLWRWTVDPSMLVPAIGASASLIALVLRPKETATRIGAAIGIVVPAVVLLYWWRLPNNYLEIPHYQAMLFPSALVAVALIATTRLPEAPISWPRALGAALLVGLTIAAGHATPMLTTSQARAVAVLALVLFIVPTSRPWIATACAIGVAFTAVQVLQNARDTFGTSTTRLYANSYLSNEAQGMMTSAVQAQRWVLSKTDAGDRVRTWVDADWSTGEQQLLPLAAFQLWGANEAGHGPTLGPDQLASLESGKPLSIAMYGKTMGRVLDFWNSLPKAWRPTPPECTTVTWPHTRTAEVCVTHLSW